jgi:hypothetical protein
VQPKLQDHLEAFQMARVKIGNIEIEMSSTQEVVSLLRQLGVVEKAPGAPTTPAANGHTPDPHKRWDQKSSYALYSRLSEKVQRALVVVIQHEPGVSGHVLATQAGIHPKGVGSVINTILATAKGMGMTPPVVKTSKRNGTLRELTIQATPEFLVAAKEGGLTVA